MSSSGCLTGNGAATDAAITDARCSLLYYSRILTIRKQLPRGYELLRRPALSRGATIPVEERAALGLRGLVPAGVISLETQVAYLAFVVNHARGHQSGRPVNVHS